MLKHLVIGLSMLGFAGCAVDAPDGDADDSDLALENVVYGSHPPTHIWKQKVSLKEGFTIEAYDGNTAGSINILFIATVNFSRQWQATIHRVFYECSDGSTSKRYYNTPDHLMKLPITKDKYATYRDAATCPSGTRPIDVLAEFEIF